MQIWHFFPGVVPLCRCVCCCRCCCWWCVRSPVRAPSTNTHTHQTAAKISIHHFHFSARKYFSCDVEKILNIIFHFQFMSNALSNKHWSFSHNIPMRRHSKPATVTVAFTHQPRLFTQYIYMYPTANSIPMDIDDNNNKKNGGREREIYVVLLFACDDSNINVFLLVDGVSGSG